MFRTNFSQSFKIKSERLHVHVNKPKNDSVMSFRLQNHTIKLLWFSSLFASSYKRASEDVPMEDT